MILDIDRLFENYLKKYMRENKGKFTEEEWEGKMAELYKSFGIKTLPDIGVSPCEYYNNMTGEQLKELLKEHVEKKISVPDYLCDAIVQKKCENEIIELLKSDNEELKAYAVNLLNDMGSVKPLNSYFELLKDKSMNENLKELATEILTDNSEIVKERALKEFFETPSIKLFMIEILARCKKDERIFKILIEEFINNPDNIPLYANYLSVYGDERAIPFLITEIEREGITYVDFQELKFAIEALGGDYLKERDFSDDDFFKKIKEN
jgi:hypothetical protein